MNARREPSRRSTPKVSGIKRYSSPHTNTAPTANATNSQRQSSHCNIRVPTSGPSSGDSKAILASNAIIRTASASLKASFRAG
ncbi:hypothetical protein D3C79_865830 [compost metagenome]